MRQWCALLRYFPSLGLGQGSSLGYGYLYLEPHPACQLQPPGTVCTTVQAETVIWWERSYTIPGGLPQALGSQGFLRNFESLIS